MLGVSVYEAGGRQFQFPGPVFTHVLLADDQSRPAHAERVAGSDGRAAGHLDGQTHPLPDFLRHRHKNPVDLSGTFPLPDSQLDRFLLRLAMAIPAPRPSASCCVAATAAT